MKDFNFAENKSTMPDPMREDCDILVKIADLGNACWVVSNI